jgi:hypothetical protein
MTTGRLIHNHGLSSRKMPACRLHPFLAHSLPPPHTASRCGGRAKEVKGPAVTPWRKSPPPRAAAKSFLHRVCHDAYNDDNNDAGNNHQFRVLPPDVHKRGVSACVDVWHTDMRAPVHTRPSVCLRFCKGNASARALTSVRRC